MENKCYCEEISCKINCDKNHTHHIYSCDKCKTTASTPPNEILKAETPGSERLSTMGEECCSKCKDWDSTSFQYCCIDIECECHQPNPEKRLKWEPAKILKEVYPSNGNKWDDSNVTPETKSWEGSFDEKIKDEWILTNTECSDSWELDKDGVKSFISNLLKSERESIKNGLKTAVKIAKIEEREKVIAELNEFVKNYTYKDNTIIFVRDLEKFFIKKLKS